MVERSRSDTTLHMVQSGVLNVGKSHFSAPFFASLKILIARSQNFRKKTLRSKLELRFYFQDEYDKLHTRHVEIIREYEELKKYFQVTEEQYNQIMEERHLLS